MLKSLAEFAARSGQGLEKLTKALIETAARPEAPNSWRIPYPEPIESALAQLPCPRRRGLLLLCGEAAPRPEEEAPLARAVTVAMPAGALIWVLAHLSVSGRPLLTVLANFLAPLGNLMGLDGMVLLAFHLAFPANEIMLPILAMGYLSTSAMTQVDTAQPGAILLSHG